MTCDQGVEFSKLYCVRLSFLLLGKDINVFNHRLRKESMVRKMSLSIIILIRGSELRWACVGQRESPYPSRAFRKRMGHVIDGSTPRHDETPFHPDWPIEQALYGLNTYLLFLTKRRNHYT